MEKRSSHPRDTASSAATRHRTLPSDLTERLRYRACVLAQSTQCATSSRGASLLHVEGYGAVAAPSCDAGIIGLSQLSRFRAPLRSGERFTVKLGSRPALRLRSRYATTCMYEPSR